MTHNPRNSLESQHSGPQTVEVGLEPSPLIGADGFRGSSGARASLSWQELNGDLQRLLADHGSARARDAPGSGDGEAANATMLRMIVAAVGGSVAVAGVALRIRQLVRDRRMAAVERALASPRRAEVFSEEMVANLPPPVRRYLLHAIAPGTPFASSVQLETVFGMKLTPRAKRRTEMIGRETLAPPRGFVWAARAGRGLLAPRVQDHYAEREGALRVMLLGVIPVVTAGGPDVTRSARHRLAIESVWLPSSLLPAENVVWEAVDTARARVVVTIDGEPVPLTLTVDDAGRLQEVTMLRHGDVGVPTWRPIPYGVRVEAEASFGGYTVPIRMRGGWWYGTERSTAADASVFAVRAARFR